MQPERAKVSAGLHVCLFSLLCTLRLQTAVCQAEWLRDVFLCLQACGRIRAALTALLGNVILLRDDQDVHKFYPRFQLMATSSFAALDPSSHDFLRELHQGYFYTNHDQLWADCARERLPALMRSTDMLMCGEDLGFVPGCVPPVMHELGIIGLRIQRMPGSESPEGAPVFAVCTAAPHSSPGCYCMSVGLPVSQRLSSSNH